MALWYERLNNGHAKPRPVGAEVHLNLWRHVQPRRRDTNFLEVGIRLQASYEVGKAYLFLPAWVEPADIHDLSRHLNDDVTLSAVFNDVIKLGPHRSGRSFDTEKHGKHYLTIHHLTLGEDYTANSVGPVDAPIGTLVTFTEAFCERIRSAGPHYLRLRFMLDEVAAGRFSYNTEAADSLLTSSVLTTEITEVRFNEMRNLPSDIARMVDGMAAEVFAITAAHCFFMRDMSFELAASHASFHKMRRLEAGLWKSYLETEVPASAAQTMLVYHWRSIPSDGGEVGSFIALAKFRATRLNLWVSLIAVVLLGALGSATEAKLAEWLGCNAAANHLGAWLFLAGVFTLVFVITILPTLRRRFPRFLKWLRWPSR